MLNRMAVTLAVALYLAQQVHAQLPGAKQPNSGPLLVEHMPVDAIPSAGAWSGDHAPAPGDHAVAPGDHAPALVGEVQDWSQQRWWISADYLGGVIKSSGLLPVVTTSPAGTAQIDAGVLGKNTTVLFGNDNYNGDLRGGFKIDVGGWLDADRTLGVDVGWFLLESQTALFSANSPQGNPILARPFANAVSVTQASQVIAFPGVSNGTVTGSLHSDSFNSANLDFQEVIVANSDFRLQSLLGYRFLHFADRLSMDTNVVSVGSGLIAAGTTVMTADRFAAENSFHGVEFGARAEFFADRWSVELLTKIAVGDVHRAIDIIGATRTTVPGAAPVTSPGGFLALASNSGDFGFDDWVFAPEAGINLGYDITANVHVRLGYSFLYWTDIARASNQVNLHINPALFPPPQAGATPSQPSFSLQKSDIWVQSLNLGVELRF
jgi:hypothetical protein